MTRSKSNKTTLLTIAFVLMSFAVSFARTPEYNFKVHNKGKNKIVKLLVSEDGKEFKQFDIGEGIDAGETVTLVWDKSTDKGACEWWFKAAFDDNEESKPVKFDFCEKNLLLEIQ